MTVRSNIHLYPSDFRSESRILREALALERFGLFSGIVLVGAFDRDLPRHEVISDGVTLHRLGPDKQSYIAYGFIGRLAWFAIWLITALAFLIRNRAACINAHSLPVLPICWFASRLTRARLIFDAHELEAHTAGQGSVRTKLSGLLERALIHRCDAVIVVGEAIADWYVTRYDIERPCVIHNVPNAELQKAPDQHCSLRARLGIPNHIPILLYQGVLGHGRGIEKLLEAAKNQLSFNVVFLGFGPYQEIVEQHAADFDNIHFHPRVPPDQLLTLTADADFGLSLIEPVSLSYELCLPNKLFEYFTAGLPVIVSPIPEQRRIVQGYEAGLVAESMSIEDLRTTLNLAASSDPRVWKAGGKRALADHAWPHQEDRLRSLYARIMQK